MSGRAAKQKGWRGENEITKLIPGTKRVFGSGAFGSVSEELKNDVTLPNGMKGEVKRRKSGGKFFYDSLEQDGADVMFFRADKKDWLVTMSIDKFKELLEVEKDHE
jgi:hypothetical protein